MNKKFTLLAVIMLVVPVMGLAPSLQTVSAPFVDDFAADTNTWWNQSPAITTFGVTDTTARDGKALRYINDGTNNYQAITSVNVAISAGSWTFEASERIMPASGAAIWHFNNMQAGNIQIRMEDHWDGVNKLIKIMDLVHGTDILGGAYSGGAFWSYSTKYTYTVSVTSNGTTVDIVGPSGSIIGGARFVSNLTTSNMVDQYGNASLVINTINSDTQSPRNIDYIEVSSSVFSKASYPRPANTAQVSPNNVVLKWTPGDLADKHNVYFGTALSDVDESATPVSFQQDANSYNPGTLDYNKTYYWRIDEVNTSGPETWTGSTWSFTTLKNITYDVPAAWQPVLIPGMNEPGLAIYGAYQDALPHLHDQLDTMFNGGYNGTANCFDPGPSLPGTHNAPYHQYIADIGMTSICWSVPWRTGPLGSDERANLAIYDNAGLFTAIQFGEWGYSFHNINGGYNRPMTSRQDCYNYLKALYEQQMVDYRDGKGNSVTGHSHYECYAGEWAGTKAGGIEVGENIAFTQSKIALTRGTSKQWNKPWSLQMSPWWSGYVTSWGALNSGHSMSLYFRMLMHGWFAGAAWVTPENNSAIIYSGGDCRNGLNTWGWEQAKTFSFMQSHDRGVPYLPVAIVMDHYAGYNGYQGKAWGYFSFTAGDGEIDDLFAYQIFPNSDHIHHAVFPSPNQEKAWLVPTPYGEMFDWYLSTVQSDLLNTYPVILLIGDITFDDGFKARLLSAVQAGSKLLMHPRHQTALGSYYATLAAAGDVEVLSVSGSGQAISNTKLAEINSQYLPITVTGNPIQYQINRNAKGWVVELIHNSGVAKTPSTAAVVNPSDVANVQLSPKMTVLGVKKWRIDVDGEADDLDLPISSSISVTVGPGEAAYIEFILPLQGDFQPDGNVDWFDLNLMTQRWLKTTGIGGLDIDGNGVVNFKDMAILMANWQKTAN